ncbi:phosphoribosylanthranilate isomerase [Gammaproteobacteria bacterium]|nr:phosphoribosylanthranilate isomerase [Gammaproteobacteria bacterium]
MNHFIKICGITSLVDAQVAHLAGADAIGLMMYKKSSRYLNLLKARDIYDSINQQVQVVLVFVDQSEGYVNECLDLMPNAIAQFHGSETPEYCRSFKKDFIKAISVREEFNLEAAYEEFSGVKILLLDSYNPVTFGGSGNKFNWDLIQNRHELPFILAGGLNPDNVIEALSGINCTGVDVSSSVESSPGKKDPYKVQIFINKVREFHD